MKSTILFHFVSSDQSKMVDWKPSKRFSGFHLYRTLRRGVKSFLENCIIKTPRITAEQPCYAFVPYFLFAFGYCLL